jgi:hypothetical protein
MDGRRVSTSISDPSVAQSHTFVYMSRARIEGDVARELVRIEAQARANNAAHDIHGALVYIGGFFIQWLEGPQASLATLRERLKLDPRHSDFYELLFAPQPPVLVNSWILSIAKRTEPYEELKGRARSVVARSRKGNWTACDLMRRMLKPSDVPQTIDGSAFRHSRVCVLASNPIWPSALMRHIADMAQLPRISRTWFSLPATPDEAALCEYVDVPQLHGASMRISCMSGWLAQSPLFELFNQEVQVLALLFRTGSAAATLEFAQSILGTRSMSATRPAVIGVFSPKADAIAGIFQDYARKQGYQSSVVYSHLAEPTAVWEAIRKAANEFFVEHEWAPTNATVPSSVAQWAQTQIAADYAQSDAVPPPVVTPAVQTPAPAVLSPPVKQPAVTQPLSPVPAPALPIAVPAAPAATPPSASAPAMVQGHPLEPALRQLFKHDQNVASWAAWQQQGNDFVALVTAQAVPAPIELLQALDQVRKQDDVQLPLTATYAYASGAFEWMALMPWQGTLIGLQVWMRSEGLNLGMVQYLSAQWLQALHILAAEA